MRSSAPLLCIALLLFPAFALADTVRSQLRGLPFVMQATAPGFSTTPSGPIDMGPSAVGQNTPHAFPVSLQINNPGTAPLTVSAASFIPSDFTVTAESLLLPPLTVNPGGSKLLGLIFNPQAPGMRTGQFIVTDNAAGSPHSVQLTGTGFTVPANDFAVILDPGTAAPVSVAAGSTVSIPIWLLAGPNLGNTFINVQCNGGSNTCSLDNSSQILLVGDSFGSTRQKIMLTVSVAPRSVRLRGRPVLAWGFPAALGFLLLGSFSKSSRRMRTAILLSVVGLLLVSCGGGSNTPPNNTLTIVATPSPGSPHSLSIPLAVH